MGERIPQSTTKLVLFKAYLSSDHVSEATGKTIAITISKNGGAFGNPNAGATNATEISSGWYKVSLDTTDTGTLGPLAVRGAVATIDDVGVLFEVVSATTGGATNLDAAVSAVKTKTDSLTFTVANQIDANVLDWKSSTAPAMTGDAFARLGAPAGASVSADIAAVKTDTAAIKTKTDSLTFTVATMVDANVVDWKGATAPAMTGDAFARLGAPVGASISADIAGVQSDTNDIQTRLPAALTSDGNIKADALKVGGADPASTADTADAIWDEATSGHVTAGTFGLSAGSLTYTVAGVVDANIQRVNDVVVTGNGQAGTEWGP